MADTQQKEWLTTEELADLITVPLPTIYKWNHKGTGPAATRVGKYTRYSRKAVDAWLAANTQQAS